VVKDRKTKEPHRSTGKSGARPDNGLLIGKGGLFGNVLRLADAQYFQSDVDEAFTCSKSL